ncbi:hypothetical protein CGZ93_09010 [Enemella dayhoffiae]|uniref:Transcriptional regulator, AbiEi antitoxin, Type IV TA system n=2 Tax=Enemella dayhoffiae TaxID=2016507 RepID=A0A255H354_9ACTN|nr:hypothetical protein CGZ93_09010 [Enemella dayhoffiae]
MGLGVGPGDIRRRVRTEQLVRLRRGHYLEVGQQSEVPVAEVDEPGGRRAAVSPQDPHREHRLGPGRYVPGLQEIRHLAAVVAAAPELDDGTIFSQLSAGVLHGLPVPTLGLGRVHLLREGSGAGRRTRTAVHHRARIPTRDRARVEGLPCTSLERTTVDLARTLPFRDGLAVVDAALARGVSRLSLFSRLTRHPGNRQARRLIELGDPAPESAGESRCRATILLAGLPIPRCQFAVPLEDGNTLFPDFGWPDLGLVGEYDGMTKYGRLLQPNETLTDVLRRERIRESRLRGQGWWVIRWIASELGDVDQFRRGFLAAERAASAYKAA